MFWLFVMALGKTYGWRRPAGILCQLSEVLRGGGEQDFVAGAGEAPQPEAIKL